MEGEGGPEEARDRRAAKGNSCMGMNQSEEGGNDGAAGDVGDIYNRGVWGGRAEETDP